MKNDYFNLKLLFNLNRLMLINHQKMGNQKNTYIQKKKREELRKIN